MSRHTSDLPNSARIVPPDTPEFRAAAAVAAALEAAGFPTRIVGGSVRDLLMGETPHDFDLVTAATPEELAKLFPDRKTVGEAFGVSLVRSEEFEFEVATAREERNYLDGRHPESVRYSRDLAVDVARRDFTVNALLLDPATGIVSDTAGGIGDLRAGIIRTVGDPRRRFSEDYLRMLRAVRFAARFDFTLDPAARRAAAELASETARLPGERIRGEIERILLSPRPATGMELLSSTGILAAVLPEVEALRGVAQPPEFHPEGDVWEHTMLMLRNLTLTSPRLAWSVLLHDVGKPAAASVDGNGRIRFFGHESSGAGIADLVLRRLRFSNDDREAIVAAVRNHMRFAAVREMREAKLRQMIAAPNFPVELELHRLDCAACHGKMEGYRFLLDRLAKSPAATALPEPWIRGRDLVAAGIPPQPAFAEVLKTCFERQLSGEDRDRDSALAYALARFRSPSPAEKTRRG